MSDQLHFGTRRTLLKSLAAVGAASMAAPSRALNFAAENKLKLGFDNFSVRAFNYKAPQLVEYAASLNVDVLMLSGGEPSRMSWTPSIPPARPKKTA